MSVDDWKCKKQLERTLSGDFHRHVRIKHCGSNPEEKLEKYHHHQHHHHHHQHHYEHTSTGHEELPQRHCLFCSNGNGSTVVPMPTCRRVANLRSQYGKSKAVTLSNFDQFAGEHFHTVSDCSDDLLKSAASKKRDQFKRRKAMTFGDPDHEYLMRSSDKLTAAPPKRKVLAKSFSKGEVVNSSRTISDWGSSDDLEDVTLPSPTGWKGRAGLPKLLISSTASKGEMTAPQQCEVVGSPSEPFHLKVPTRKDVRSGISGGGSGSSEESDGEPSSPLPRRGRRQAICGSKSLEADEGDLSPSTSSEKEINVSTLDPRDQDQDESKRRSSADVDASYPCELICQVRCKKAVAPLLKRNTIADFANTKAYQESTASLISACDQDKKGRNSFSILKLREKRPGRMKNDLPLAEVLLALKPSHFKDVYLISHKDSHWLDLISGDTIRAPMPSTMQRSSAPANVCSISDTERKRREAVWELFRSECVFLIDHLMVLKHCFMEPLKKVQVEGHLMFAEPQDLFGNLDELCYVSYTFSRDFISLLLKDKRASDFGRTEVLIKALRRFCQLTRDGEVYHEYCLNYSKAISYLEQLRKNDDFCEFEKWCGQDSRCHRLQLPDLLISPMQHCTKVPLLLNNIRRYTEEPNEQFMLTESLEKLESSLENLEAKMLWLKNFERIQEIQQQIVWQPISELDPRAFIPEFLRATLSRQPCERLLCSSKRRLLYEGPTTLLEVSKAIDMYMFLFDDILLLSRVKKAPRKKPSMVDQSSPFARVQTDGAVFVVHRQPIALDRFVVHDVRPLDGSGGVFWDYVESSCEVCPQEDTGSVDACKDSCLPHLYNDCSPSAQKSNLLFGCVSTATVLKNAFVIVQVNRFQQIIGVYTLQAPNYSSKAQWMSRLHDAQESYKEVCRKFSGSKRLSRDCNVGITVHCENESFVESPRDLGHTSAPFKFLNPQKVPPELLLGVPFGDLSVHSNDDDDDETTARNRKIRSCSSDAAAAMQQEEYGGDHEARDYERRTSDPICQRVRVESERTDQSEQQEATSSQIESSDPQQQQQQLQQQQQQQQQQHQHHHHHHPHHPALSRTKASPMKTTSFENVGLLTSSDGQLVQLQSLSSSSRLVPRSPRSAKETPIRVRDPQSFTSSGDFLHPDVARKPLHASLKIKRRAMMKAIHERSQSLDNTCPL